MLTEDAVACNESAVVDFRAAREQIARLLIQYTLIDSYHKFRKAERDYPFVQPSALRPGAQVASREYHMHNNVLITLVDGSLPERLRKHFRCRTSNQVKKRNIAALAPGLPGLDQYDPGQRRLGDPGFGDLLRMLMPLDFSLLIQRSGTEKIPAGEFQLTHFHVKIERLFDSALRAMGIYLNYLERSLYERGEDFMEDLEKKFFEFFNFYHNAAGRRSAAALAAQVMALEHQRGTVFITSQQDRRLTLLTSNGVDQDVEIEQYLLVQLEKEELAALSAWGAAMNVDVERYLVYRDDPRAIAVFRARYSHTEAARPSSDGSLKPQLNAREKWVRLVGEALVSLDSNQNMAIGYPFTYSRLPADCFL
ncbi:MAG: hypothetical protein HQL82_07985 [Magnetococcales bacterium]|nr:hypothetical protein [Magnetococcales bacterium]